MSVTVCCDIVIIYMYTLGPTAQQLKETSFQFDFRVTGHCTNTNSANSNSQDRADIDSSPDQTETVASGTSNSTSMRVKVSGPEPGYVATPMIFIALARCLLDEYKYESGTGSNASDKSEGSGRGVLPAGGVLTPQAVFSNSLKIFDFLNEAEIIFEVV